jgi:hypothetical protein
MRGKTSSTNKKYARYFNGWKWSRNRDRVRDPFVVRYSSSVGCYNTVVVIIGVLIQVWTSKSVGFVKKMLR